MSKSKMPASKADSSGKRIEKGKFGSHSSDAPKKPEKPTPKTKGEK